MITRVIGLAVELQSEHQLTQPIQLILWSGCPTDNSNCILRFTTTSETIYGRDWSLNTHPYSYEILSTLVRQYVSMLVRRHIPTFPCSHVPTFQTCNMTSSCD